MCLTIERTATFKIATEPIFVYKFGRAEKGAFFSERGYMYKVGVKAPELNLAIDHLIYNKSFSEVNVGYHSFNYLEDISQMKFFRDMALFVIPEGASYIEGWYNDTNIDNRVSSTIIYLGKLESSSTKIRLLKYKITNSLIWERLKKLMGIL